MGKCRNETTSIVGYLLDLISGEEFDVVPALNPQAKYGGDVISRINFAGHQNGVDSLHKSVTEAINKIGEQAAGGEQNGAQITNGMRGVVGVIDHIAFKWWRLAVYSQRI